MERNKVSLAVVRRLPRYYRHLEELQQGGVMRTSSKELAQRMGLTASQIRQDLNCFGGFGQQGYGYNVPSLKQTIAEIMGVNHNYQAVLIGVGNLGRALISNFSVQNEGFTLIGAFDLREDIVGKTESGVPVMHIDTLEEYVADHRPELAVLTVTGAAAEDVAGRILNLGMRGLWNFTNVDLHLPEDKIKVENVHLSDSLMTLCYQMSEGE